MEQISSVYRSGRRGVEIVIVKDGDELLYALKPNKKIEVTHLLPQTICFKGS